MEFFGVFSYLKFRKNRVAPLKTAETLRVFFSDISMEAYRIDFIYFSKYQDLRFLLQTCSWEGMSVFPTVTQNDPFVPAGCDRDSHPFSCSGSWRWTSGAAPGHLRGHCAPACLLDNWAAVHARVVKRKRDVERPRCNAGTCSGVMETRGSETDPPSGPTGHGGQF